MSGAELDRGPDAATAPSDAFRRKGFLLGVIGLDLSSLLWMTWGGGFALLMPPKPASILGASQNVVPFVVGLAAILVVLYRRQADERAGCPSRWLSRVALFVSMLTAGIGGLFIAWNLDWIRGRI